MWSRPPLCARAISRAATASAHMLGRRVDGRRVCSRGHGLWTASAHVGGVGSCRRRLMVGRRRWIIDASAAALGRLRAKSLKAAAAARPQRVAPWTVDAWLCRQRQRYPGMAVNGRPWIAEAPVAALITVRGVRGILQSGGVPDGRPWIADALVAALITKVPAHPQQGHRGPVII